MCRNFLTDEQFRTVTSRDHNFAGYMDIDGIINPTRLWTRVQDNPYTLGTVQCNSGRDGWERLRCEAAAALHKAAVYSQIHLNHGWLLLQSAKAGEIISVYAYIMLIYVILIYIILHIHDTHIHYTHIHYIM